MQMKLHASPPRPLRSFDRSQTLMQLTWLQAMNDLDGISTVAGIFPPLQHPTRSQTSSNPSLATVLGGEAHKTLFVVKGRQVAAANGGPGGLAPQN